MDEERTTTAEIDGQTWRAGDIGVRGDNGCAVQLSRWGDGGWYWTMCGDDSQMAEADERMWPVRKIHPPAPVKVFVVASDYGLNGIDVHGVYSTRPDDATVRAFIGIDDQGNATSAGPRVSGTGGYGGTEVVEFVLDADLK